MTDWNQFKADRHNSGLRRELEGPNRIAEEWTLEFGGSIRTSPVVRDEVVFVGTDRGSLYAIDRERRHRRWVFEATAAIAAAPIVGPDRTYVPTADGVVHALETATGERLWRTDGVDGLASSPALADGVLLLGHDTGLTALEAETGEAVWSHESEAPVAGTPAVADARSWSGPRTFAGTADETAIALEVETGEEVWESPTDGTIAGGPTVADGRVFVADDDGTLLALDADSGQAWFTYEIDAPFTGAPTVLAEPGTTFVGAADGYLHVTDTRFGRRKVRGWLFSKTGVALDGPVRSSPVVVGDVCCVGDETGSLYGVDVDDFDLIWHTSIEGGIEHTPAIAPERLYVPGDDRLHCLSWTPGEPRP